MREQIEMLERTRDEVHARIQSSAGSEQNALVEEARVLNTQIRNAYDRLVTQLAIGEANSGRDSLAGAIKGEFQLTTTFNGAAGPFKHPITLPIRIENTVISVGSFIIKFTFPTPLGTNTMTITKARGGTGSYGAGRIVLPITLRFDQSIDPGFEVDSMLDLVLSTDPPGSAITPGPNGAVTLVGSGVFTGGVLAASSATIVIVGDSTVAPRPIVEVPDVLEVGRDVAIRYLKDAKLQARLVGETGPDSWVYRQSPKGGARVPEGTTVTLSLRDGPIP
jgi:hypothetical protein